MTFLPVGFENVDVLEVGVNGPGDANRLFVVTGVAIINFKGPINDWNRDAVSFLVPQKGTGNPAPLDIGQFRDSVSIAFPATIDSSTKVPVGWGIDSVDTLPDGEANLRLTARVAVLNPGGHFIRMGFQVNILSRR
jgi:hypothetical protein